MRYLCIMFAAALLTAPALGQEMVVEDGDWGPEPGDWELALSGSGTNDEDFEVGDFSINADLGYYLNEGIEVGVRQRLSYRDTAADELWSGATRAFLDWHFGQGQLRPFIGASIGYIYGDDVDDTFAAGPEAGLKWYVKDETFLFGRAEYQFFFDDADEAEETFDDGQFIYTIGIGFNF